MKRFLLVSAHKWDPPSPPAALDYVAAELEKVGIMSDVADCSLISMQELESLLQGTPYDGVCLTIRNLERTAFSEKLHFPLPSMKTLVQLLKKYCSGPIIVGGNGFSISPERILEYINADYGIHGTGEESLPLLVRYLFENEGNLQEIPYLVYRENHGIRCNPPSSNGRRLLPAKRGYIDYSSYFKPGYENFGGFGNVETKRGCPHNCVYCVEPAIKGRTVQVKAPEDVTQEVDWFQAQGIDYLFLTDSEFNTDCEAAVNLLRYWKERDYHKKIHWLAYATPSNFSEELAELLPQSGNLCLGIDFGHASDRMLSSLGKGFTLKDIEETISLCRKHGVNFKGSLILGGPGETRETIREAIEFFQGVTCEITLSLGIRVFPNTPFGEKIMRHRPLVDNPNLYGKVIENDNLLEPVYYISHELGEDIFDYIAEIARDPQQFYTLASPFKVRPTMYGHFRGVTPEYETAGAFEQQFITPVTQGEALSSR